MTTAIGLVCSKLSDQGQESEIGNPELSDKSKPASQRAAIIHGSRLKGASHAQLECCTRGGVVGSMLDQDVESLILSKAQLQDYKQYAAGLKDNRIKALATRAYSNALRHYIGAGTEQKQLMYDYLHARQSMYDSTLNNLMEPVFQVISKSLKLN